MTHTGAFRIPPALFVCSFVLLLSSSLYAQEEIAAPIADDGRDGDRTMEGIPIEDDPDKQLPQGWHLSSEPAGGFSFIDNRNVVGQPDGYSMMLVLKLDNNAIMKKGCHEWRNQLLLKEALLRTVLIDEFILVEDQLKVESMYLYYIYDWFGPYARFLLDTNLFPKYDARPESHFWSVAQLDGSQLRILDDRIRLAGSFMPLNLKQGVGPFFRPLSRKEVNLEFLLGLGARETFAKGLKVVDDDKDTPDIDVKEVDDAFAVGFESLSRIWGDVWCDKIRYMASAEFMMPFYNSPAPPTELSTSDLLYIDLKGTLGVQLAEWFSVNYELRALKDALIVDEWQIQNYVLLTFGYRFYKHIEG